MRDRRKGLNLAAALLAALVLAVSVWGLFHRAGPARVGVSDGIEQVDLDTICLPSSGVEVRFTDVILAQHNEKRQLVVSTQRGTVTTELTDRLIRQLDFDFLKKTQNVSYTGTGYFVVDLDQLTAADVTEDREARTVTIRVGHARLEAIEIDPEDILIDEVQEGLLAWGDIKLSVADYRAIEQDLRARLQEKFDTAANGQAADALAVRMVRELYEPVVRAVDRRYRVIVELKD